MQASAGLEPEYWPWRPRATLFTTFGILALIVAAILLAIAAAAALGPAWRASRVDPVSVLRTD